MTRSLVLLLALCCLSQTSLSQIYDGSVPLQTQLNLDHYDGVINRSPLTERNRNEYEASSALGGQKTNDQNGESDDRMASTPGEPLLTIEKKIVTWNDDINGYRSRQSKVSTTKVHSRLMNELVRMQRSQSDANETRFPIVSDSSISGRNRGAITEGPMKTAAPEVQPNDGPLSNDQPATSPAPVTATDEEDESPLEMRSAWTRRRNSPSSSTGNSNGGLISTRSGGEGNQSKLAQAINSFAFKLFNHLQRKPETANVLISPYSLFSTLVVLRSAAGGASAAELTKMMELEQVSESVLQSDFKRLSMSIKRHVGPSNQLNMMNAMLVDERVNVSSRFVQQMETFYNLVFEKVAFESDPEYVFKLANHLVQKSTHGQISQLLSSPPHPLTKILLLNAVYFKGAWKQQFNAKYTSPMPFHNGDGTDSPVPTMRLSAEFESYCEDPESSPDNRPLCALTMPYVDPRVEMILVTAAQPGGRIAHSTLQSRLSLETLQALLSRMKVRSVQLSLPRFQFEDVNELKEPMKSIGAPSSFSNDPMDLSRFLATNLSSAATIHLNRTQPDSSTTDRITKSPAATTGSSLNTSDELTRNDSTRNGESTSASNLFVNQFRHKCALQVDETGSVASGATVVQIGNRSGGGKLTFDRPFAVLIRDRPTGVILFIGRVTKL